MLYMEGESILDKIKRRGFSRLLTVILIAGLAFLLVNSLGVEIMGRSAQYVGEYNAYYLFKKEEKTEGFLTGDSGYKVWFAPSQKRRMLEKIRKDVVGELENLKANYGDVLKSYEISEDFKKITCYYEGEIDRVYDSEDLDLVRIETKVELFHQVIHGYGNSEFQGEIIEFVEVERKS